MRGEHSRGARPEKIKVVKNSASQGFGNDIIEPEHEYESIKGQESCSIYKAMSPEPIYETVLILGRKLSFDKGEAPSQPATESIYAHSSAFQPLVNSAEGIYQNYFDGELYENQTFILRDSVNSAESLVTKNDDPNQLEEGIYDIPKPIPLPLLTGDATSKY